MKILGTILICVLFVFTASFSLLRAQSTYYVSSSQGNDSYSGTTQNQPFKSLSKVKSLNLKPGDRILFKSGDKWIGENLVIKNSGTSKNRIFFSKYGTGSKPIISLRTELPNWKTVNNWTLYSSNIYVMNFKCIYSIQRLWIDGVEVKPGNGVTGTNYDGTSGVNSLHKFYFNESQGKIYVYSANKNPTLNYSSIQYPGNTINGAFNLETISLRDADYITIDGLDIQGGLHSSISLGGSDFVEIINCNIGKYSNFTGLSTQGVNSSDQTSDYGVVSNNIIDSDWHYNLKYYNAITPEGIVIGDGASHWKINDNYIKDWWVSVFVISFIRNGGISSSHDIYNNEMTNPNFTSFGYPLVLSSDNLSGDNYGYQNVSFYNNYCHDFSTGIELASSGNKIFNNIFANYTHTDNEHDNFNHNGWGISSFQGSLPSAVYPSKNYIFNNIFYDMEDYAYLGWGKDEYWYNNLFINAGKQKGNIAIRDGGYDGKTWKNNLFYNSSSDVRTLMVIMDAVRTNKMVGYSVNDFNHLSGRNNKIIAGNLQYVGSLSNLMNAKDFSLPAGSPALNAGIDISALVSDNFKNEFGNNLKLNQPNIGPIYNFFHSNNVKVLNKETVNKIKNNNALPTEYNLSQNFPNPFNPSTKINFALVEPGNVNLEVYNTLGQKVTTLIDQEMSAGFHEVNFNSTNLASGVYIYKLNVENKFTAVKKMILMK